MRRTLRRLVLTTPVFFDIFTRRTIRSSRRQRRRLIAASRLVRQRGGVDAPLAVKQRTAQHLLELYGVIGDPPPQALRRLATGALPTVSNRCVGTDGPAV